MPETKPLIEEPHSLTDYSLVGVNSERAIEKGLADAAWYTSPVSKKEMRALLTRKNGPAIRDTLIWFGLIGAFAYWSYLWWGSWQVILPLFLYGTLYGSTSDSRWHESSHGTAFKSDWMNNLLYEVASFMVMRESTIWRWSHTRHHSDTIIVGRDPEIAVPRPPSIREHLWGATGIPQVRDYFKSIIRHSFHTLTPEEQSYVPEEAHGAVKTRARIYLLIYLGVAVWAISARSVFPLFLIGLPTIYGSWLMRVYGYTQHAGLAENVLDHRLNCRTVKMNFINRYLYWNMNYHVEHHMFPLVPYHALPRLYEIVKDDMPPPYTSIWDAYKEIIPAFLRQRKDPAYYVKRSLPTPKKQNAQGEFPAAFSAQEERDKEGWVMACPTAALDREDVVRFDYNRRTYAIYRTQDGKLYASDGICSHGNAHLADGMVKGNLIECPKHNGRFDVRDGSPVRLPVCVHMNTYPVKALNDQIYFNPEPANAAKTERHPTHKLLVVSNRNVATFIKELVLEPETDFSYQPGDYLQIDIPEYQQIDFDTLTVDQPYANVWKQQNLLELYSTNPQRCRRNYSLASNPKSDSQLRFNVRIATPPRGQECSAGAGSTYIHSLKPGDSVTAIGPFGDFHIKETQKEMIYLGGGAGMAPLRSHISSLLETRNSGRKISFWYGARSKQEMFYQDYFEKLAKENDNFRFTFALSEPQPEDDWNGDTGFIHEVLAAKYLDGHDTLAEVEFYLCGPPQMLQAASKMLLEKYEIAKEQIAYDEF
ncbi:NADH:ubiquinone reductase (Na(+)-transporting) subunit F [Pelagicoccus mobilis]|uniref:Na(+)-translocating NADH-quinone reductase subunit F n=1 Tax=Pelagicoccus mobilis TaxID=415221 RepID=A0A934S0H5_9BACT|nr:NADH:ubiquinone reductase (Na(+)-transporting) subunit F [Pelagicoccus mobilis]MBK1878744.1 NADH:ubiquinone reductase (Na(+)-transporting) subunit F [Pelagicoccus mobilis]